MKTYEEVAKSVFEKSEKYFEEKALRAKHIKTAVTAMSCFCLAAVITVGAIAVLNGNLTENPLSSGDGEENTHEPFIGDEENNGTVSEDAVGTVTSDPDGTTFETFVDDTDDPQINDPYMPYNIWLTPEEVLARESTVIIEEGVGAQTFLAYNGAVYVTYFSEDQKTGRYYAPTGDYAYFDSIFPFDIYAVKDEPNLIAIKDYSGIWEYRRLFYCNFEIDGEEYEVIHRSFRDLTGILSGDYGRIILETDDFTVYEDTSPKKVTLDKGEYLVDLLPSLKREMPNMFSGGEADYFNRWWIARPKTETTGTTFLSNTTLTDVTPKDIDKILETAQAVSSNFYKTVLVPAEKGSDIYSLVDGVVVMAEDYFGLGYTVEIETADGQHVRHFHLSEMLAEVGDTVTKGQVIGLAGTTGITTCSGAGYNIN